MAPETVATRVANALIANARATVGPRRTLDRFAAAEGGLWVGGRVTLTTQWVAFHPNGVNRAVQTGSLDVEIPLADIEAVEVLPGFFTRIIAIATPGRIVKIRCYRAEAFAGQIRDLAFGKTAQGTADRPDAA